MESKTARLTVLVDPEKKKAFERLCSSQDLTSSQVVRQLIRDYLADHDVSYGPAARSADASQAPDGAAIVVNNPIVKTPSRKKKQAAGKSAGKKAAATKGAGA